MAKITGTSGNDTLTGGIGNDIFYGYAGNDRALMGAGNDVFIWNVGDGKDTVKGGSGDDTFRFYTDDKSEIMAVYTDGTLTQVARSSDSAVVDLYDVERIDLKARGGGDLITVWDLAGSSIKQVAIDLAGMTPGAGDGFQDSMNLYGTSGNDMVSVALVDNRVTVTGLAAQVTISNMDAGDDLFIGGGTGNDTINASSLPGGYLDLRLNGYAGNDQIAGSKGNDQLYGDAGNDLFLWQAGGGIDGVEGGTGSDTVRLTGSNAGEHLEVGSLGAGSYFSRNGMVQVEADDVERIQVRTLGGADTVDINDLTGTDVRQVTVDLAATAGGTSADAKADTARIHGSAGNDFVDVAWINGQLRATGLTAEVSIAHAGTNDRVIVSGGLGNDTLNAAAVPAGKVRVQLYGDIGDDVIFGSASNDTVVGGLGNDVAFLGAGNDRFVWEGGDGGDRVEGQAGTDTFVLNGADSSEVFEIFAAGDRADIITASGVLDLNDVEQIRVQGFGGADMINVNNLAGTDVDQVAVDLGLAGGVDDASSDFVFAMGTIGHDQITLATSSAGVVSVTGLGAELTVSHGGFGDSIQVLSYGGDDVINASAMPATTPLYLVLNGGWGNDKVTGGAGGDVLIGDAGNDTLRGGGSADTIYGLQDNDLLDGGSGSDDLLGGDGDDVILGGLGDDAITGGAGNDTITGGAGSDSFKYASVLDGHDVILDFDGNATDGQDTLNLDALFDALGIVDGSRAGLVLITDNGGTVDIRVNADGLGGNGFELYAATLNTADQISIGQDVILAG